jgi:acetyltransferase
LVTRRPHSAGRAARATGLRLVGPKCLGVLVPRARLNASFATRMPGSGDLAVISQSGAIVAGMIEWAAGRAIGFSAVISVGDQVDVDFGDLLDLRPGDGYVRSQFEQAGAAYCPSADTPTQSSKIIRLLR